MRARLTPFFFGASRRRLFGVYHAPLRSRSGGRAALLCNPWGHEYIYAHRSMVKLSERLAAQGFHVLRFDYYGAGDSGGDGVDADLDGWREDILTALEELCVLADAERATLIGLRLGATLAAGIAAENPDMVDGLALWDPVIDGAAYVAHLHEAAGHMPIGARPPPPRPEAAGGGHEIIGFPLTRAQAESLAALDLTPLIPALPRRLLVLASREQPEHAKLNAALAARTPASEVELLDDKAAWHENWPLDAGSVPVQILGRLAEWRS